MKIQIDDSKTIAEIQKDFQKSYPYLKLEFFKKAHNEGEGSARKDLLPHNKTLGEVRTKHNEGSVFFSGKNTVNELEKLFEDQFGIHAQVFRKAGNAWLETTQTDNWPLKQQNGHGIEAEAQINRTEKNYGVD